MGLGMVGSNDLISMGFPAARRWQHWVEMRPLDLPLSFPLRSLPQGLCGESPGQLGLAVALSEGLNSGGQQELWGLSSILSAPPSLASVSISRTAAVRRGWVSAACLFLVGLTVAGWAVLPLPYSGRECSAFPSPRIPLLFVVMSAHGSSHPLGLQYLL